ncbi:MAG: hypothetical protein J5494_00405, partial [Candidatus Methanomethylophilaceae archaeon]|nr:hypothetical protein [Candidatus Methanomethylophilaceae archaeon]
MFRFGKYEREEPAAGPEKGVNEMSWELFDALPEENIVFSPFGIYSAFSLLLNGAAEGSGAYGEVSDLLRNSDREELNGFISSVSSMPADRMEFGFHNLVLADSGTVKKNPVNKEFEKTASGVYGSAVRVADFRNKCEEVREMIREWVRKTTRDMIPDYEPAADSDTVCSILNVVYLKARWAFPFSPRATSASAFTNSDGSSVSVRMMYKRLDFGGCYYSDGKFRGLSFPYAQEGAEMFFILPASGGTDILELWKSESAEYREDFLGILRNSRVSGCVKFWLPKLDLAASYDLKEIMKTAGRGSLFSDTVLFKKIIDGCPLYVDGAKHESRITVDEDGTEAAAVTEICMALGACAPDRSSPVEFRCNVPFIFVLSYRGISLFAGYAGKLENAEDGGSGKTGKMRRGGIPVRSIEILPGVRITSDRCLILDEGPTMVLGDLHLGYERALENEGVYLPRINTDSIRES